MADVVQKLWGFCHTLRHDGIGYTEYIEQITFLLFLKMADERAIALPNGCTWSHLKKLSGTGLLERIRQARDTNEDAKPTRKRARALHRTT